MVNYSQFQDSDAGKKNKRKVLICPKKPAVLELEQYFYLYSAVIYLIYS